MNVGVIASMRYAIQEPFAGGMEMHTCALATNLRRRGHQVTVFAAHTANPGLRSSTDRAASANDCPRAEARPSP